MRQSGVLRCLLVGLNLAHVLSGGLTAGMCIVAQTAEEKSVGTKVGCGTGLFREACFGYLTKALHGWTLTPPTVHAFALFMIALYRSITSCRASPSSSRRLRLPAAPGTFATLTFAPFRTLNFSFGMTFNVGGA